MSIESVINRYFTTDALNNQFNYVFAYDKKDLFKGKYLSNRGKQVKREIMSTPEWRTAENIYDSLLINSKPVFKKQYKHVFVFIIYAILISPDIKKMAGGAPTDLMVLLSNPKTNKMYIFTIISTLISLLVLYTVVDDLNRVIMSQNILYVPDVQGQAYEAFLNTPQYKKYEMLQMNDTAYKKLNSSELATFDLVEKQVQELSKNIMPQKISLLMLFTSQIHFSDIIKSISTHAEDQFKIRMDIFHDILYNYGNDAVVNVAKKSLTQEVQQNTDLLNILNTLWQPSKQLENMADDVMTNINDEWEKAANEINFHLSKLRIEAKQTLRLAVTSAQRKLENYIFYIQWIMRTMMFSVFGFAAKLVHDKTKKRIGRPVGSKNKFTHTKKLRNSSSKDTTLVVKK